MHVALLMTKLSAAVFDLCDGDVKKVKQWLLEAKGMTTKEIDDLWTNNQRWFRRHKSIRKSIPPPAALEAQLNSVMLWAQSTEVPGSGVQPLPVQELLHVHENQIKLVRKGLVSGKLVCCILL
jgi:hypothetical protein